MFCSKCGTENNEENAYCLGCGASLGRAEDAASGGQKQVIYDGRQGAAAGYGASCGAGYGAAAQPYQGAGYYTKGCASSAWHDVKASQGWLGKMLLLGLVNMVPVLSFVVPGYALRWARGLSFGDQGAMPEKIFGERAFATGFFWMVITAVFWMATFVAGFILGFVPFIGVIAALVLGVFAGMFQYACGIRMAVVDRLGAGFSLSRVWEAYGRQLGSLFCATYVPGLIVGLIAMLVEMLVSAIVAGVFGVSVVGLVQSYGYGYYGYGYGMAGAAVVAFVVIGLIMWYFASFALALSTVLTLRALGHWASRYAPEWASEFNAYGAYDAMPPYAVVPQGGNAGGGNAPTSFLDSPSQPNDRPTVQTSAASSMSLVRNSGEEIRISTLPATLGKGTAASVCIDGNSSISRVHARVMCAQGTFAVEDLSSTNGTFLNGNPVSAGEVVALRDGDTLKLGDEILRVVISR